MKQNGFNEVNKYNVSEIAKEINEQNINTSENLPYRSSLERNLELSLLKLCILQFPIVIIER